MPRKFSAVLFLLVFCLLAAVSCSPAKLPPLEGEPAELADEFISCLDRGDFEDAVDFFDVRMKRAMPAQTLEQTWKDLVKEHGSYEGQTAVSEEVIDGYDVVFVTAEFAAEEMIIRVVFGEDRRVAGLWFEPVQ